MGPHPASHDSPPGHFLTVDGNEAAARIAHRVSEVVAIYPITPASPMGELADSWSSAGKRNLWDQVPDVIEMQSEAGAAGVFHGALQAGAMATTFTASQGLLLMIPNLYKIAGELLPAVIHVAARTVATHALSIFGDHSDVMAARQCGWAMLASSSVQQAQDMALISHAATLRSRIPFLHFFDGFRTSHEVSKISGVDDSVIRAMIDDDCVGAHRARALDPDSPVLRGSAQNPDVFFQAREASEPWYRAVPGLVQAEMDRFAQLTGRQYHNIEYYGHGEAERVLVIMGSGAGTVREVVEAQAAAGERVGMIVVRLFRPFDTQGLAELLPPSVTRVGVLDRTKEPGAVGDPLFLDVVASLASQRRFDRAPEVVGARYGLSSKEFTPPMVLGLLDELARPDARRQLTVGIVDDLCNTSVDYDEGAWSEPESVTTAVFYGLGSDGTVGANKNTVKIVGENTSSFAQGYFVYDSKKSGSTTVSHLRFDPEPIRSAYLVAKADFVGIHHFASLMQHDILAVASPGATVLINSPFGDKTWQHLPANAQAHITELGLDCRVIDANQVAATAGLRGRVNTVLQTCFFALTELMPVEDAIGAIKQAIEKTYGRRGQLMLRRNNAAVDSALEAMTPLKIGEPAEQRPQTRAPGVLDGVSEFVQRVTSVLLAGDGDKLPVSALPVDGTFPTGTSKLEKRSIADQIPIWDPDICIDCARCALICPHGAIRLKLVPEHHVEDAPDSFRTKPWKAAPERAAIIQVAPDDCTGCGVCVNICPAKSKEMVKHKAINMRPIAEHLEAERANFDYFLALDEADRTELRLDTVKGSQQAQPLFEFSGACAGCGETPYLKLLSQMMGDRLVIANATGCSSIYGGNLPTTPWTTNDDGRGPAWANSLFEDNAEFGLGIRMAVDHLEAEARSLLDHIADLVPEIGPLAAELLAHDKTDEASIAHRRDLVDQLNNWLDAYSGAAADRLATVSRYLVDRTVWLVGGDGWAYDIGFGGVDHVMASGRNVNILVLDTEVYSNTGGQTSKATPRSAVAKFSASGKATAKKDLGMIAMAYGDVYVGQIAMGANMNQTVKTFAEAAAHPGPSLIIAYSPCIAHGIDMSNMAGQQKLAVDSGYWPLYRYDPSREMQGDHNLHLDSRKPTVPFKDFAMTEARFAMLARANQRRSDVLMAAAQQDIDDRWHLYEQMVDVERTARFGLVEDLEHDHEPEVTTASTPNEKEGRS